MNPHTAAIPTIDLTDAPELVMATVALQELTEGMRVDATAGSDAARKYYRNAVALLLVELGLDEKQLATVEALLTTAETRGVSPWEAAVASGEIRTEEPR